MNKSKLVSGIMKAIKPTIEAVVTDHLTSGGTPVVKRASAKTESAAPRMGRVSKQPASKPVATKSAAPKAKPQKASVVPQQRAPGQKRSPFELQSLRDRIVKAVRENPGIISEDIASALGVSPKEISGPLKAMRVAGTLRTEGEKRYTRHFV